MTDQTHQPRIERSDLPMIALVGRANVGKSTLWNRIVEERRALISAEPHTTRDRNIAQALWRGCMFEVVDTGGLDTEEDEMGRGIRRQAERAVKDADLVVFMVDGRTGVVEEDRRIAKQVRKLNPNVILVVNKIDKPRDEEILHERALYSLGLGAPVPVSASTGKRVGDMLDAVYNLLEALDRRPPEAEPKA
ncbi:MAG TPA: GTPase, partial [Candidatus Methylomirabilis sp.]|nr:GTPase [Candidatus Methylomirabilis sp.]